jgi:hypothetical protein
MAIAVAPPRPVPPSPSAKGAKRRLDEVSNRDVRQRGSRLGRGRAFLGGVDARWRRSTVKASYSRNGRSASWAAHGTCLGHAGAGHVGGTAGLSAAREAMTTIR